MFKAYANYWKNYFNFNGRSRRSEYWWPILINGIINVVAYVIMFVMILINNPVSNAIGGTTMCSLILFSFVVLVPNLAVAVRRLHDTGKSGWFLLINLIPLVGFILMLILLIGEGTLGDNQYGENPKTA